MTTRTLGAQGHARSWRLVRAGASWMAFSSAALSAPGAVRGQVIAVKSAPIADGGQFAFLPSANLGRGGLSIALADSALDPFVNPAKGARLRGARVFGAPTFFAVSRKAGGGFTLPVGTSVSSGAWFGQFAAAMQELDDAGNEDDQAFIPSPLSSFASPPPVVDDGKLSRQNRYLHGMLGRRLGGQTSVALSASWWALNAIDGVELYYRGSQRVRQHGEALDLRLGVLRELGRGQSFEAVAVHNRLGMNHDVAFTEMFWDPTPRQFVPIARLEPNADRTDTWGLHLAYTRPLADSTWRVGAIVTGNRIRQPRLPAYDLPEVPATAGRAQAYNIGGGISRSTGTWTLGADAILEPIWSRTWVRADRPTETRQGLTLGEGTNTLDNRFRFTNGIARVGLAATLPLSTEQSITFESGGQLRAIRYHLDQRDAIEQSRSSSTQNWNEWTRSWGVSVRFATATLHYRGRLTTGAGRPGLDDNGGVFVVDDVAAPRPGPGFTGSTVDPFGLTFGGVRATTHQISLSVPIR
jgi:hypothetical protein